MKVPLLLAFLAAALAAQAGIAPARLAQASEEDRRFLAQAEKFYEQRRYKDARDEFDHFIQLNGKSEVAAYAQLRFGECARQLHEWHGAISAFRDVIDYFPESVDAGRAQYLIGVCQQASGEEAQAVKSFETTIAKWPKDEAALSARRDVCALYWKQGKMEKWVPHMESLAAVPEESDLPEYRPTAACRLLVYRIVEGKFEEARAHVEKVAGQDPLVTFAESSLAVFQSGDFVQLYGDVVKEKLPGFAIATVAFIEKQSPELTAPPQRPRLDRLSARLLAQAGAAKQAAALYTHLVEDNPANDGLRLEYARSLRAAGQPSLARPVYRAVRDRFVADEETAQSFGEESDWKNCAEAYRALIAAYPDKAATSQWALASVLHHQLHQCADAIAAYRLSQREPEARFCIAECQTELKQYADALQTLIEVRENSREDAPRAVYQMGCILSAKGDKEGAIRALKAACIADSSSPWAKRAFDDLRNVYGLQVVSAPPRDR
ncbi:MAG TPA: tetratricopeptide repeat protein [Chthoniobacteraceae bacterium]|nr:tetratricopeptide repeat protein [Chthoniobacteraceae bacterium]